MAKVTVRVLNAIVDGKRHGEQLDIEEKSAAYLSSIGYVERVKPNGEAKQRNTKGHAAKKKSQEKGQKKEVGE